VKATVNTLKKAISFKNDLFSDGSSGDPDVILDPFEFRCVARIFLTIRRRKGARHRLCAADMKDRELYTLQTGTLRFQGIQRLFFGKDQKKLALDKEGYKWVRS
jgi:hypothetical protein